MSPFLQAHPSCARPFTALSAVFLTLACLLGLGCGEVICPEPLSNIDGVCRKADPAPIAEVEPEPELEPATEPGVERCDGEDNDGDTEVDENWPALGEPCGDSVGQCVVGVYACSEDGLSIICDGSVGPSAEVCDGEDNDCDGLVDEGVLSVKSEVFADHASVTSVAGGFVLSRLIGDEIRIETYDTEGERTGRHDDVNNPSPASTFLESDAAQGRVLVALGKYRFHALEVVVDASLVPVVLETSALHADWQQGMTLGVYNPPLHPRVLASPSRFLGYRDAITFALNPIGGNGLAGLAHEPTIAMELPMFAVFDAAGAFVAWEQFDNIRAGLLLDGGSLYLDIDVARGTTPAIAIGDGGPGIAYVQDARLRLTELGGLSLQCLEGRFCDVAIVEGLSEADLGGPTGLAYDKAGDTWFVLAGTDLNVVGRADEGAVIKQSLVLDALDEVPKRVDVAVSGGTVAVLQATQRGDSALSFLGCF